MPKDQEAAVAFTLNGETVAAQPGETIWQVAERQGVEIPHLCYSPEPGYRADGNCRACMVEIEGERVLAASCIRTPSEGMVVDTASERAAGAARRMVLELLLADQPARADAHDADSKLWRWADADRHRRQPLRRQIACPPPIPATRRWRSISTPASTARSACAPAARSRSTT